MHSQTNSTPSTMRYPVIKADSQKLSDARIALTQAIKTVMHNALNLIGVVAPEKM